MEITISQGDLAQTVYAFTMINDTVYLNNMFYMERETTRHKFKIDHRQSYGRIDQRSYGMKEEPDVPIEVSSVAVWHYREKVVFKQWKESSH